METPVFLGALTDDRRTLPDLGDGGLLY